MNLYSLYYVYCISLLLACISALYRFRQVDIPSKIIAILICCDLANEIAAYFMSKIYHTNLPLYVLYCIIEYIILCMYFNNLIDVFIKNKLGVYIAILGVIFGIINIFFIQGVNSLNTYFLLFEGISIIGMSLFAFFRLLLKNDHLNLFRFPHFWFLCILLFFWSVTFLYWGMYEYLNLQLKNNEWKIFFIEMGVGIITYTSFTLVFLFYPKMKQGHD